MARPRKKAIPENLVESMAAKGCDDADIAPIISDILGQTVTVEELRKKCGHSIELGRAKMKRKLKEAQIALTEGEKPNPVMLIWLGKQYLGQADKVEANNRLVLQEKSGEVWRAAFGTSPGRTLPVSKILAPGPEPAEGVH